MPTQGWRYAFPSPWPGFRPVTNPSAPTPLQRAMAPQTPPPDFYSPALDQNLAAAQRGYGDLGRDFQTNYGVDPNAIGGRQGSALTIALEDMGIQGNDSQGALLSQLTRGNQDFATQLAQLQQSAQRNAQDLGTQQTRAQQDAGTQLADILRGYQRAAVTQTSNAVKGGASGGALRQAMGARAANRAHDEAPVNTALARTLQGIATASQRNSQDLASGEKQIQTGQQRLAQDYGTQKAQLERDTTRGEGKLIDQFSQGRQDANTQLTRAKRELDQFGLDTQASRIAQATPLGWRPQTAAQALKKKTKRSPF